MTETEKDPTLSNIEAAVDAAEAAHKNFPPGAPQRIEAGEKLTKLLSHADGTPTVSGTAIPREQAVKNALENSPSKDPASNS